MAGEKQNFEIDMTEDFEAQIFKSVNRYYQEVTLTKIDGQCPYGQKEGDTFRVTDMNYDSLCGALYQAIHSYIVTLHYGGGFPFNSDASFFKALCPEMRVQVDVTRIEHEKPTYLRTKTVTRDMAGKGYPCIDKHRVFLEILNIERHCGWGHKAGQRYEIDSFNIGGACGYLYWGAYDFMNLLFSGGCLPWEADENIIHGACPDIFNQVSYRLIREKR
jgi:uncharacterized repeat protein (TIGR04076 family)